MPTSSRDARGPCRSLSPVSSTGVRPSALSSAIASRARRLDRVGDDDRPARAVPRRDDVRPSPQRPSTRRRAPRQPTGRPAPVGRRRRVAVDDRLDPSPARFAEALDRRQRADLGPRAHAAIACAIGCSLAASAAPASRSDLGSTGAVRRRSTSTSSIRPSVTVPVLSSTIVRDPARLLEDLRPLDQDAELRAAAGADHQRGRRRQTERARAGDDQHGDGGGERVAGVAGRERASRRASASEIADHDRHEDGRDAVDEPLDRRLAGLRLGDEARDLRERRVRSDLRRADDEPAVTC